MKYMFGVALFFSTAITPSVLQSAQKVSLELGSVKVWLGMTRGEVLNACAAAKYKVLEDKSDDSLNIESNSYRVEFKSGRVSAARRSWLAGGKDGLEAVLGALATLDKQNCVVISGAENKPDVTMSRVSINCGARSVLILRGRIGRDGVEDVFEWIGSQ